MVTGHEVAQAALEWIGTPYLHQASCKGAGTDCLGLIRGIWRDCVGQEPVVPPPYTSDWAEADGCEVLLDAARTWLVPRSENTFEPGCVLLFRMRQGSIAKHLGIVTAVGVHPRFVHAYSGHGVVETTLSAPWRRRIAATFEYPKGVK
jgi:NlpC/P60 family putative phage cell wall peptidase